MSAQVEHNRSSTKWSFYLVEQQNEVQGKCEEQSQKTQVVEVSGEVVLQKSNKKGRVLIQSSIMFQVTINMTVLANVSP